MVSSARWWCRSLTGLLREGSSWLERKVVSHMSALVYERKVGLYSTATTYPLTSPLYRPHSAMAAITHLNSPRARTGDM